MDPQSPSFRSQPGILDPVPSGARYLFFRRRPEGDLRAVLEDLAVRPPGPDVVGLGPTVMAELSGESIMVREHPRITGPGVVIPSTPCGLWCWLRGDDRGELLHRGRALTALLAAAFELERVVEGFVHDGGRDLTGYEDGTENPEGDRAVKAALVADAGPGQDGSSYVAVQIWRHDLGRFQGRSQGEQDRIIGRRRSDNVEIDDAPATAHVKRTAQEAFEPEAFVLRRSMPWSDPHGEGLVFVAFGRSHDAYEALLHRMTGVEDGTVDALFSFTRPETGAYFWCPPVRDGRLDFSALGL